tara:strand:- start:3527 stop:3922 length:396 start_codon:yes stop_codon:yes gene_type:complete
MSALDAAGFYAGLNVLILLVLGFYVSMGRRRNKLSLGHGDNPAMNSRMRAHGNAAEWIPGALIGLVLLALMGASAFLIHGIGLIFTIGRGVHGWAMATNAPPGPARMIGALITYATYGVLGAGLLYYALAV